MKTFKLSLLITALFAFYSSCNDQSFQPDDLALYESSTPIIGENGEYILEPQKFTRGTLDPTTFQVPLIVENFQCFTEPYYLSVINGDGNGVGAVTSAIVSIDGKVIFSQSDFNKKVHDMMSNVSIKENSVLTVELRGKSGTNVTVSIEGTYSPCRWEYTYGETSIIWDGAPHFVSTSEGGFIFLNTLETENGDISSLVKLSSQGLVEWEKKFDHVYLGSIVQANDGGYVVSGFRSTVPGASVIIKTDAVGNIQWERPDIGGGGSIIQTTDNGYLVGGSIKLTSTGEVEWKIENGFGGYCAIEVLTGDGGFVIGGGGGEDEFAVAKISKEGEIVWFKTYGHIEYVSVFTSIVHDGNGGFVLAGHHDMVCNIDSDGSVKFFNRLTNKLNLYGGWTPSYIIPSSRGFIIGYSVFKFLPHPENIRWNCCIVEIDHEGMQLRDKVIERETQNITGGIAQSSDGDIIIGGNKSVSSKGNLWAAKVGFDD